jgi:hypothetical protein
LVVYGSTDWPPFLCYGPSAAKMRRKGTNKSRDITRSSQLAGG